MSTQLDRITFDEFHRLLAWLADAPKHLSLDSLDIVHVCGLVALAKYATANPDLIIDAKAQGSASRFAHAVGFNEVVLGEKTTTTHEPRRTVRLTRVRDFKGIEPASRQISALLIHGQSDAEVSTRRTVYYIIVELLRNVIQHSGDQTGGIVAAQVMDGGPYTKRPMIQIAVADAGIGIENSLRTRHSELNDAEEALEKALWPYFSGTFDEGFTGSIQNAGMGLFFVSEMAKLAAGKLLIATRGASLWISGDVDADDDKHEIRFLPPQGLGFPGTMVCFELPDNEIQDYDALITTIGSRGKERTPQRVTDKWFRFVPPPAEAKRFLVNVASEDTVAAQQFSENHLQPHILKGTPVSLNFTNMPVCTQSFLHALLFEVLRLAWAKRTPIYIENSTSAVRSGLELLESYALSG